MKIDSGLNGYHYPNRTQVIDRTSEEAQQQREGVPTQRAADALTGSSTLFSPSLASALWAVEIGEAARSEHAAKAISSDRLEDLYQEFA